MTTFDEVVKDDKKYSASPGCILIQQIQGFPEAIVFHQAVQFCKEGLLLCGPALCKQSRHNFLAGARFTSIQGLL